MNRYAFLCFCTLLFHLHCSKTKVATNAAETPVPPPTNISTTPSPTPTPNTTATQQTTVATPNKIADTPSDKTNATPTTAAVLPADGQMMQYYVAAFGRVPDPRLTRCYRTLAAEMGVEWIYFGAKLLPQHHQNNQQTDAVLRQKYGSNWQKDLEVKVEQCMNQP